MDPVRVAREVRNGLSPVCATCSMYWEARDKGVPDNQCLKAAQGVRCGSPLIGDSFSGYEGPMGGDLERWCFICAEKADFGIRAIGKQRFVGICRDHLGKLRDIRPVGTVNGFPKLEVRIRGSDVDYDRVVAPSRPRLIDVILDFEEKHKAE